MITRNIEFNSGYSIQLFSDDEIWLGSIVIDTNCDEYARYKEYCNGDKLIKIIRVETNPNHINEGIASKLIKLTIKKFKKYNIVLLCSPCKRLEDTDTLKTVSDLEMFYSKFGFKRTKELVPTMILTTNN